MAVGVAVEDDPGTEHATRVGERLDSPHQLGRRGPPLALDEGSHVHAGPVLGLERAVIGVDDHRHQLLHERLVALDVGRHREVRGQHEVQVPRRRVAGDPAEEAVLGEQLADVARGIRDPRRRDADVLDDERGARRSQPADQPVQALADPPEELDHLRVAGEVGGSERIVGGEHLGGGGLARGQPLGVVGTELDQQRR